MRASSGPWGRVEKPLIQVSDERLEALDERADIESVVFIEINTAEYVDATQKGLIIRASLLKSTRRSKGFRRCETGLKRR
jgi:hypothetical protein